MSEIERVGMSAEEAESLDEVVRRTAESWTEGTRALLTLREQRGYRHLGFTSFETYCQDRLGWSRDYGYKLLRAAEVARIAVDHGLQPPATERQARELVPLLREQPEIVSEVWREAVETAPNGHMTAAHVQTVVERHRSPTPIEPADDSEVEELLYGPPIQLRAGGLQVARPHVDVSRVFDDLPSPEMTRAERAYTKIGPLLAWIDTDPAEVAATCAQEDVVDKVQVLNGLVVWINAVHDALKRRAEQSLTVVRGGKTA